MKKSHTKNVLESLLDISLILTILSGLFYFSGVIILREQLAHTDIPFNIHADYSVADKILEGAVFICTFVVPILLFLYCIVLIFKHFIPAIAAKVELYFRSRFGQHPLFFMLLMLPIIAVVIRGIAYINGFLHPGHLDLPLIVKLEAESFMLESSADVEYGVLATNSLSYAIVRCERGDRTFVVVNKSHVNRLETKAAKTMNVCVDRVNEAPVSDD